MATHVLLKGDSVEILKNTLVGDGSDSETSETILGIVHEVGKDDNKVAIGVFNSCVIFWIKSFFNSVSFCWVFRFLKTVKKARETQEKSPIENNTCGFIFLKM